MECTDILTYPQYSGTCWFNSLVTVLFYSDRLRRLVQEALQTKADTPLFRALRSLLKVYKKSQRKQFLKEVPKPQKLIELLYEEYPNIVKFNPYIKKKEKMADLWNLLWLLTKGDEGFVPGLYFPRLLNVLFPRKNYAVLLAYEEKDHFILYLEEYSWFNFWSKAEIERLQPDILIFDVVPKWVTIERKYFGTIPQKKKIITCFNSTYILDSCVLSNFNKSACGHAISGITCNRRPFVFNGWILGGGLNAHSCPLEPFDWKTSNDDFSLSEKKCMLTRPNPRKQIFNFQKGDRCLIYVKTRPTRPLDQIVAINDSFCPSLPSASQSKPNTPSVCDPQTRKRIEMSDPRAKHILDCLEDIAHT